jgi:DNA-directed RNA polymerase specialized sigma24 family protein
MLVCLKGMSYQDAAQKLGISPELIKDHLLRSRLTLIHKLNLGGEKAVAQVKPVRRHPHRKPL